MNLSVHAENWYRGPYLVILSDKYLRSPHCMFELSEIWRTSRHEEESLIG
jgi:hypothetical protein